MSTATVSDSPAPMNCGLDGLPAAMPTIRPSGPAARRGEDQGFERFSAIST